MPSYASWLNQVERSFGLITHQAIRLGPFRGVKESVQKFDARVNNHKLHRPFVCTASFDSIIAKLQRLCKAINGTITLDNSSRELPQEIVVSHASQKVPRFLLRFEPPSG